MQLMKMIKSAEAAGVGGRVSQAQDFHPGD